MKYLMQSKMTLLQAYKKELRHKLLLFYVPILVLFYGLSSPFCPASSMEKYERSYLYSRTTTSVRNQNRHADLVDFSPSSTLRRIVCFAGKTYLTSLADRQIEEQLPARYADQTFDWANLLLRLIFKGASHFAVNVGAQCLETGTMLTREETKQILYTIILDVSISELANNFIPDEDKELAKTLAKGITQILFQSMRRNV